MNNLSQQIEAILFWKAQPVEKKAIAQYLNIDNTVLDQGIKQLSNDLKGRGLTLIEIDDRIALGTSREYAGLIERLNKEELNKDIGKAGLETLSIILYEGPITRAQIDYIRGVNSQFILRTLLIRGLVERIDNPKDKRAFLYKPTVELLAYLGISKVEDLPEIDSIRKDIADFMTSSRSNNDKIEE